MPLVIVAIGIALLLFLTIKVKLNTFISLILVSIGVAMATGMQSDKIVKTIESGLGGTLGHIALIFGFGVMLGRLLADAGAAQRIALTLLNFFGEKRLEWAVVCSSFIVGIALFFEVGLILLIPIIFAISKEAKISPMYMCVPMTSGLIVAHGFLPPHPGPTVIAGEYGADIGKVLIYGLLTGIPTFLISGPILNKVCKKMIPDAFTKAGSISSLGTQKSFSNEEMPGFGISILTAMLPVALMAIATMIQMMHLDQSVQNSFFLTVIQFLGNATIAMLVSFLFALYTMGIRLEKNVKELMDTCGSAIAGIAGLLLIIGGGGAFKQVLINSGVGDYIAQMFAGVDINPLIMAWSVAALLRICLGSATVAAISTAGLVIPMLATHTGTNLALVTLATGAGSCIFSHVNDASFWMIKEFFGLTTKETFLSWSLMSTVMSIMGLLSILTLNVLI
ncbi:gluconate:H+ symporter [Tolumonas auensis]|uniref:gluconate:H+ symporter n=1 Tax=Tolumonas auensis TaxID=43948 RepID=UPI002AA746A6|nr:gluconate:H+ symporter [Tolumonas auensis]